jgi:hypothetical protein
MQYFVEKSKANRSRNRPTNNAKGLGRYSTTPSKDITLVDCGRPKLGVYFPVCGVMTVSNCSVRILPLSLGTMKRRAHWRSPVAICGLIRGGKK